MNIRPLLLTFCVLLLAVQLNVTAQDPPPSYGPAITLEQAKKVAAAAEAEARKNKWNVVISIVDSATNLVLLQRMDDTQIGSIKISQKKAYTAAALRRSTKVFEDQIAAGGMALKTLANDEVIPIEGGLPITVNGKIIGAIGVSGVTSQQDGIIAKAGAEALK
ncbi:MAG TPA: heme-binding protein [Blastocatellia bacterium]|nr:heme-binding protein [Blastocatellia bacterium]